MKTLIAGAFTFAAVTAGMALPAAAQYGGYYEVVPGRPVYAQPRYGEPVYGRRYLIERPLGPRYLDDRLSSRMLSIVARDRGIERIDRIRDGGDIYIVDGVDTRGGRVRATFDAYDGTLIDRRRLDGMVAEPSRPNRRSTAKLAAPPAPAAPKAAPPSEKPEVVTPAPAPATPAAPAEAAKPAAAEKPANASAPAPAPASGPMTPKPPASKAPAVAETPKRPAGGTGSAEEVAKAVESSKAWAVPVAPADPADAKAN